MQLALMWTMGGGGISPHTTLSLASQGRGLKLHSFGFGNAIIAYQSEALDLAFLAGYDETLVLSLRTHY